MINMFKFQVVFYLLSAAFLCCCAVKRDFKFVEYMNLKEFDDFKESSEIRVVYFYQREISRLQPFYREYERSAELLKNYNVKCAVVDCTSTPKQSFCGSKKVEHYVYAFRDGYELLQLELESMFDVNSIMSNILQLVMLRDVPIVQSEGELSDLEHSIKGQHDLIFAYHRAIGTYEHRLFMDIAYAYQSQYKFAVTTEKMTVSVLPGSNEDVGGYCMLWALNCKHAPGLGKKSHCAAVKYTGKFDMVELASFVKGLSMPAVYHMPEEGVDSPYPDRSIHVLHLYHDNQGQAQTYEYAKDLSAIYWGMLGILTVNVESRKIPNELKYTGSLPTAVLKFKNVDDNRFISGEMDLSALINFVRDSLNDFKNGVTKGVKTSSTKDGDEQVEVYADRIDEIERVENEDDQVAYAVNGLKKNTIDLTNVPALTDKTFPQATQTQDLLFVLFYLKVDVPSYAFLHTYAEVGTMFSSPAESSLARVECFDWTDVCSKENITEYPTIHIYRKGQPRVTYRGHLEKTSILNAVQLFKQSGIKILNSEKSVNDFISDHSRVETSKSIALPVLGLLTADEDISEFSVLAKEYEGRYPFGIVTDEITAKKLASHHGATIPSVLVFKGNEDLRAVEIYGKKINATKLGQFLIKASVPTFGELTAVNFPLVYQQFKPLLIVFRGGSTLAVMEAVADVAVQSEFSWLIFSWMNVSGVSSLGSKILYEYTKQPKVPHISVVIRHQAEVYNFPAREISSDSVREWLRGIKAKTVSPSMNLPRAAWRPKHEGFDFLRMIDEGLRDIPFDDETFAEDVGFDDEGYDSQGADEGFQIPSTIDEIYRDEDEVGDLEHSRLSSHHKRPIRHDKAQSQILTTTASSKEHVTHDAGEL